MNNYSFIKTVAESIIANYTGKFDRLKVLLPSGFLCVQLQEELLKMLGTTILPSISSFSEITAESEEIFKIPSKNFGTLSPTAERMVLAEIINEYQEFNYSLANSIRFAAPLSKLLYEIEAADIKISELESIPDHADSVHWQQIYRFLAHAYDKWHKVIAERNLSSRAANQKALYNAELERIINNEDQYIFFAGVVGTNKISRDFISKAVKQPNAALLLPYIPLNVDLSVNDQNTLSPADPLYLIKKLVGALCLSGLDPESSSVWQHYSNGLRSRIKSGMTKGESGMRRGTDALITGRESESTGEVIQYYEFSSIYDEADYIAAMIAQIVSESEDKNIALLCPDHKSSPIYKAALDKYGLGYHDLIGDNVLENNAICLLLDIAEFICKEFSLTNFFKLISSPEIACEHTRIIKQQVLKENRFASSLQDATESVLDEEAKKWLLNFEKIITMNTPKSSNFTSMLLCAINITEKLAPELWQRHAKENIADSVKEIYSCKWQVKLDRKEEFARILRELIAGGRLFTADSNGNITFARVADVSLAHFEQVFICDFSEGKYPKTTAENPWINKHMQQEFNLQFSAQSYGMQLFDLYQILQNPSMIVTRSVSSNIGKPLPESSFILKLMLLAKDHVNKHKVKPSYIPSANDQPNEEFAYADQFPGRISATDIELLIRAPYNFYAKKILGLRKIEELDDQPTLAEFGSFFHETAELYTNDYCSKKDYYAGLNQAGKIEAFTAISEGLLANAKIPASSRLIWRTKILAIAPEFVEFEDSRQMNSSSIFTEIRGKHGYELAGGQITISAIADRIELDDEGCLTIIDYKTGTPPSKAEIFSGLSPQLIVEAIIANHGGFKEIDSAINSFKLLYVKIASRAPYLKLIEYSISKEDLADHEQGLKDLLQHYMTSGKYPITDCNAKYDDYKQLARR